MLLAKITESAWDKTLSSPLTYFAVALVGFTSYLTQDYSLGYLAPFIAPLLVQFAVRLQHEAALQNTPLAPVVKQVGIKPKVCLIEVENTLSELAKAQDHQYTLVKININIATEVIRLTTCQGLKAEYNLIAFFDREIGRFFGKVTRFSLDCSSFIIALEGNLAANQALIANFKREHGNHVVEEEGMFFYPKLLIGTTPLTDDAADSLTRLQFASNRAAIMIALNSWHIDIDNAHYMKHKSSRMSLRQVRQTLANRELGLYVQPIVALQHTQELPKYEILLRQYVSKQKVLGPAGILAPATYNKVMQEIDLYVVQLLCENFARIFGMRGEKVSALSVNISGTSLGIPNFAELLDEIVTDHGIPKEKLVLEVTEDIASTQMEDARTTMDAFRGKGFRLALDDIGTGSSNFQNLKNLPIDFFKIDRAYCEALLIDKPTHQFVSMIIDVAKSKGKHIIAEGIPDEATKTALINMGVDYSQSFLTGQPYELIRAPKYD